MSPNDHRLRDAANGTAVRWHLGILAVLVGVYDLVGWDVATALLGWGVVTAALALVELVRP